MDNIPITLQNLLADFLVFLPKILAALVIFVVGLYLSGLLSRMVRRSLATRKVGAQVVQLVSQIVRWVAVVVTAITALQQVEFDLTAFIAGLGVMGFALGFAVQDIVQNFIAGIMLMIQQPFEIGDFIEVSGYTGEVLAIDLRATQLKTRDGEDVLIPNGQVFTSAIVNYTHAPERRLTLQVGVAYDSDLDHVAQVALEAIGEIPFVLKTPPPSVSFHTFGSSSIDMNVYYWYNGLERFPPSVVDPGVRAIKKAFDRAGIEIPFPIRTVYMHGAEPEK